jgi:peptidyl-tRNA hydrolase, PTH1 family
MPGVPLKLIAGLGNPGAEYVRTRHNAGFWFADELARRHGGAFRFEGRHQAELARVRIGAAELWLVKPTTYMNASGMAVGSVAHFYKIAPEEVLVAYDELDFPPGKARLRQGGGTAGHNGVADVVAHLGEAFWRLRIGIGRPAMRGAGIDRVLSRPAAEEERLIRETIEAGADAVPVMLEHGAQIAMNRLHSRDAPSQAQASREEGSEAPDGERTHRDESGGPSGPKT